MIRRKANAQWMGNLKKGTGKVTTESGALNETIYNFANRFEDGGGTNPEELIGAAHAACFSMELASKLSADDYSVESIKTSDTVFLEKGDSGFSITKILMKCEAKVDGIDKETLNKYAQNAKNNCIISKALAGIEMELELSLSLVHH